MSAGLYVHIPFCVKKCGYCDFYSVPANEPIIQKFLSGLKREILIYSQKPEWRNTVFDTIYLGGGTPSLLSPQQLSETLIQTQNEFSFVSRPEITMEVNPESASLEKIKTFQRSGGNRLSIGIQSFLPGELRILGRIHTAKQAAAAIRQARLAGFENIGIDLIFGIPGQSMQNWQYNLKTAVAWQPEHISTYGLTIENGTPLAGQISAGKFKRIDDESERGLYLETIEFLTAHGYEHYEISNFARPDFRSIHNHKYWDGTPYLGLGPSAHSYYHPIRHWNFPDLEIYRAKLSEEKPPVEAAERLTREQQMLEWIFLGLRKRDGVLLEDFKTKFDVSFQQKYGSVLERLQKIEEGDIPAEKFISLENDRMKLTLKGLLVYNEVCAQFA